MNPVVTFEFWEVREAGHSRLVVSIFIPFELKMSFNTDSTHSLKTEADHIELELRENYRMQELNEMPEPPLADPKKVKEKDLLNQLEQAAGKRNWRLV